MNMLAKRARECEGRESLASIGPPLMDESGKQVVRPNFRLSKFLTSLLSHKPSPMEQHYKQLLDRLHNV